MAEIRYNLESTAGVVRACHHDDATDLVAVTTEHTCQVLLVGETSCQSIACFHLGGPVTSLAWSPRTVSPSVSDEWLVELALSTDDYDLHVCTKSHDEGENVYTMGAELTGHHGRVNDMTFCGGRTEGSPRYLATVSDDKVLLIWDLYPSASDTTSMDADMSSTPSSKAEPVAYPIKHSHALTSVCSHPSSYKELLVGDCQGSLHIVDWRTIREDQYSFRRHSILELIEPRALARGMMGFTNGKGGSVAWRWDSPDIIGAVYGSRYSIWDLTDLRGGKPKITGVSFPDGNDRFRWCPTNPTYFGISPISPAAGAVIHVHNMAYPQMEPEVIELASPRLQRIRDFDFLATQDHARVMAAIGRYVIIAYIKS
ncbi:hypothetical protein NEOLEDRAFT_1161100 [Neolentinus lepideus HHB14362 ss-1]|uniref:Uncharacterized protein n=1 Tax=Neolentinus lepideus HHB14362 ss-1 TaxID=1314782 RepID=A0A165USJ7_9AGAM|nr:hypothetical protein NEOLEDRAFT_1161100 [Neolentinus lepideus HHB14362 ss-1]